MLEIDGLLGMWLELLVRRFGKQESTSERNITFDGEMKYWLSCTILYAMSPCLFGGRVAAGLSVLCQFLEVVIYDFALNTPCRTFQGPGLA